MIETVSSGLEVAKAATVVATIPGEMRSVLANPTVPRTNSSPPPPAHRTPNSRKRMFKVAPVAILMGVPQ